ncbi:MAG: hypothetical protein HYU66_17815 [Armatimonadetes bacterium]|nr:hypothetical protein [Armatimonadota bacterium]
MPPSAPVPAEAAATLWCFEHFLSGIAVLLVGIVLALAAADPVAVFGVPMLLAAVWMVAITSKRMPRRGQGSADRLDGLLSRHATWLEHMVSEWRDTGVPDWCYDTDQAAAERIQQEILRRVQSGQLAVEVSDSSISLAEPADADTARTGLSLASDEAEPLPRLTGVEDSQSVGREELDAG